MFRKIFLTSVPLYIVLISGHCFAQTIRFELHGIAGPGILADNEPADVANGGSGGLGDDGITLDLNTGVLSIDVAWGSQNGFTDLSSDIDFMNIHGPTSQIAVENFAESADTFSGLNGFDPAASSGGYIGDTDFAGSLASLLEGRYYLHLHTFVNGGGEARGYLVPEVVVGDVNGDNQINLLDIAPFVEAIGDGEFIEEADINRDGSVNLLDIESMIVLLGG